MYQTTARIISGGPPGDPVTEVDIVIVFDGKRLVKWWNVDESNRFDYPEKLVGSIMIYGYNTLDHTIHSNIIYKHVSGEVRFVPLYLLYDKQPWTVVAATELAKEQHKAILNNTRSLSEVVSSTEISNMRDIADLVKL